MEALLSLDETISNITRIAKLIIGHFRALEKFLQIGVKPALCH
jgi:hypothetical protein